MLKFFSESIQFNERITIVKMYLHFKHIITLHVVAMARTKNTARSNPFVLPQATLADHMQAIPVSTDVEAVGTKETGSSIPTGVNESQVENVEIVQCLEVNSPDGEPEPLTPPEGDLHTPVFPEVMGQNIPQTFQIATPAQDKSEMIILHSADHPLAFLPTYFSPNMQSLANSPAVIVPMDAVTLLVPLNPVAADHTVTKTAAPKDITDKKLDTKSKKENQIILPLEKVSSCDPGYLGPYRSHPNFT